MRKLTDGVYFMNSLTKSCTAINHVLGYQSAAEALNAKLSQLDALLTVAVSEEFLDYDKSVIYDYLWLMNDVTKQARIDCEGLI
jgi:hypothetical protein